MKPDESLEQAARQRGYTVVCGCDEAGAGPLMGPVCAGAVILPPGCDSPGPGRRGGPCGPAWRHGRRGDTAEAGAIVWPGVGRRVARILNPRFPS